MNVSFDAKKIINPHFLPLLYDKSRHLLLKGGAGSGKSHFVAQKHLLRILDGYEVGKVHKFLVLRKTQPSARNSVYELFRKYLVKWKLLNNICSEQSSRMTFHFTNGSQIMCGGLDKPEKLNSIEGITGLWFEEAVDFNESEITQVNLRIRGELPSYKQTVYSFNPVNKQSHLYRRFYEHGDVDGCRYDSSTYTDNPWIDEGYKSELEDLINRDKVYYDVYCKGEWGVLGGLIFSLGKDYDIIPYQSFPNDFDDVCFGLDFGFNNPSALVLCGIYDDELYFKELLYESGLTNSALIKKLGSVIPERYRDRVIYADSAEPARIEEINDAGFECQSADKSVFDGIDYLKSKKKHVSRRSVNLVDELGLYKHKQDKNGNYLDEPVKFKDHIIDACRYAAYSSRVEAMPGVFSL